MAAAVAVVHVRATVLSTSQEGGAGAVELPWSPVDGDLQRKTATLVDLTR